MAQQQDLTDIKAAIRDLTTNGQQLMLAVNTLQSNIKEQHERLMRLETRPSGFRADLTGYGGCLGQVVFATMSTIGTLMGIISLVIALKK